MTEELRGLAALTAKGLVNPRDKSPTTAKSSTRHELDLRYEYEHHCLRSAEVGAGSGEAAPGSHG
jgi:hypothetical protein